MHVEISDSDFRLVKNYTTTAGCILYHFYYYYYYYYHHWVTIDYGLSVNTFSWKKRVEWSQNRLINHFSL